MDDLRFVFERGSERFEIIEEREGWYVLRYVDGSSTHDYLQDDLSMAHRCAEEEWGVAPVDWRQASPGDLPLWRRRTDA